MLEVFINALIATFANLVVWSKLLNKNIDFKNHRVYIGFFISIISLMCNFVMVGQLLKIICVLLIILITAKYTFNLSFKDAIILSIINELIYIVSEVFVIILVVLITNIDNSQQLVNSFFNTIYANILISFVVVMVVHVSIVKKIYSITLKLVKNEKVYIIVITSFLIIAIATILFNFIYYDNNLILLLIICLTLLLSFVYFIIKDINIENNYLNIYGKYNSSLEALKSYEDILDKYKVSNHENKNQLLTIRHMLGKEQKNDVSKYIDGLIKNEYQDNEELMMETTKIPAGGLRALIYSKLIYMKNNNIEYVLKIDRKIRGIQLIELNQDLVLDICKIFGVFLDNSIDEVKKMSNGSVSIELYLLDEKLNIAISNNFDGFIDLDKISEIKYTTKGKGHGYGLTLVKDIISKNNNLENIKKINDNVFTQILKITI